MSREGEYRQLADDMFRRAANEQNAQLEAQWKILGAKYVAIAEQSPEPTKGIRSTIRSKANC